jgi:hypothetical protein
LQYLYHQLFRISSYLIANQFPKVYKNVCEGQWRGYNLYHSQVAKLSSRVAAGGNRAQMFEKGNFLIDGF